MRAPERNDAAIQFVKRHLPPSDDVTVLVLKGHLLAETFLNSFLAKALPAPERLDEARLTFRQTAALVASLHQDTDHAWLWQVLDKLNSVRNELAHTLNSESIEHKLDLFIQAATPHIDAMGKTKSERLWWMLVILCGVLYNLGRPDAPAVEYQ